ncbi:hypothetical protein MTR67_023343 [Solanum verrucosum]|uniref:Tf2-1-like SH3-like domain-containing protein n=1 Tax=Solanum verrucosum TaxID=315347 RepID=A0AAF0QWX1_SOLVR|nr:hypothetical protein MTR67_023343 [Solanum verrucosum]
MVVKECSTAMLNKSKRINLRKFLGRQRGQRPVMVTFHIRGPMDMVVLGSNKGFPVKVPLMIPTPTFNKNNVSNPKPQDGNGGRNRSSVPTCQNCGKIHPRKCLMGTDNCIGCGMSVHFLRDCPSRNDKGKDGRQAPPSYLGSSAPKKNRSYEFQILHKKEGSPDVVISMLKVFHLNVYALLDPSATLSFVMPYVVMRSKDDHADHLRVVLEVLKDQQLFVKFSKCEFLFRYVVFLGHIISGKSIKVDLRKMDVVKSKPRPLSPSEIKSVLVCVAHEEEDKKELVGDVHRLARLSVRLVYSIKGGVVVHNGSKSSFVSEMKAKPSLDPILVEFAYNSSYHSSIFMDPFEVLYGRRCRSPIGWFEVGEVVLICPELVHEAMEKVRFIREIMKMDQRRRKSYADVRRRDLEFDVGDWVYLNFFATKGVKRFGKKGKLSPRYVGLYQILRRIGRVTYVLDLPNYLVSVHPVFHVSLLKKCVSGPIYIVPLESLGIKGSLYEEVPIEILDPQIKKLRNQEVASVKVLWRNQGVESATWETKTDMMSLYPPSLFPLTLL